MLNNQVRRVIAKYIEDPDDGSSYSSRAQTWMEYEDGKNRVKPENKNNYSILKGVNPNALSTGTPDADEFKGDNSTYNPYDYKDPSTKPKDIGDSGVFENNFPSYSTPFYVNRPSLFKEEGPLYEWAKSRREDWTEDPTQQNPAISLDRRFSSKKTIQNVLSLYLLSSIPVEASVSMIESPIVMKTAATLLSVNSAFKSGDPNMYTNTLNKSKSIGAVNWVNQSDADNIKKGLYQFKVPSSSSSGDYDVYLQFLRTKDKRQTPNGFLDFDVQMSCSCKSFLYFGAQYYAVNDKYMYMPGFRPSLVAPHSRTDIVSVTKMPDGRTRKNTGKGLNFRMCKHLLKVLEYVQNNLTAKEVNITKNYPLIGRPSALVNTKRWEDFFKIPFTMEEIQKYLLNPSNLKNRPSVYFTVHTPQKSHYDEVDKWVADNFSNLSQSEKSSYIRFLAEHPEEIFYILWSYAKLIQPNKIDFSLISTAYDNMAKTIVPESEEEPESVVNPDESDENQYTGEGMTGTLSPKDFPNKEEMKEIEKKEEKGSIELDKQDQSLKDKNIEDKDNNIKTIGKKDTEEPEDEARGVRKTDIRNEI